MGSKMFHVEQLVKRRRKMFHVEQSEKPKMETAGLLGEHAGANSESRSALSIAIHGWMRAPLRRPRRAKGAPVPPLTVPCGPSRAFDPNCPQPWPKQGLRNPDAH